MQALTAAMELQGCQLAAADASGSFTVTSSVPPPYMLLATSLQCNQAQKPCPGAYTSTTVHIPEAGRGLMYDGSPSQLPVTVILLPNKRPVAQRLPSLAPTLRWRTGVPPAAGMIPPELHVSFAGCNGWRGNVCNGIDTREFFTSSDGSAGLSQITISSLVGTKFLVWLKYECARARVSA